MGNKQSKIKFQVGELSVLEVKLPYLHNLFQDELMGYPPSKQNSITPEIYFADYLSNSYTIDQTLDMLLKFVLEDNRKRGSMILKIDDLKSTFYGFFRKVARELDESPYEQSEIFDWISRKRNRKVKTIIKSNVEFNDIFKSQDYPDKLLKFIKSPQFNSIVGNENGILIQANFIILLRALKESNKLKTYNTKLRKKFQLYDYVNAFKDVVTLPKFSNLSMRVSTEKIKKMIKYLP